MNRMLTFGVLFGFVLSRAGATDYDAIFQMFALRQLHLVGVIATAIVCSSFVFWLIRRHSLKTITGEPVVLAPKGMKPGLVLGGLMFGAAWALSGTCPGTALAQLGEGKFAALATVAGIALSSALTEAWLARAESRRVMSASSRTTPA